MKKLRIVKKCLVGILLILPIFVFLSSGIAISGQVQLTYNQQVYHESTYGWAPVIPYTVAMDSDHNVYMLGYSYATSDVYKFNYLGQEVWSDHFKGGSGSWGSITVDKYGQVYVATGMGTGTVHGLQIVKYKTDGTRDWVVSYKDDNNPRGIAVDGNGNVFVAAHSSSDYCVIKLSPSGQELWVRTYNGPGNSYDNVEAIAVDAAGNAYVTGMSIGLDQHDQFCTIKYYPDGTIAWIDRYGSNAWANSIAVDSQGNSYVTGMSFELNNGDFVTIKYNTNGQREWVARFDVSNFDVSYYVAVDNDGNVYVAGSVYCSSMSAPTYALVKYSPAGQEEWRKVDCSLLFPAGLGLDGMGNVYIATSTLSTTLDSPSKLRTIKYAPNGQILGTYFYDSQCDRSEENRGLAVSSDGVFAVLGGIRFPVTLQSILQLFDTSGNALWENTVINPGVKVNSIAKAVVMDSSNNFFITGNADPMQAISTMKFDSSGNKKWGNLYGDSLSNRSFAEDLAIDSNGNCYVTGQCNLKSCTIKYDYAGNQVWDASWGATGTHGRLVRIDSNNNIYVTGDDSNSPSRNFLIKYDSFGVEQWAVVYVDFSGYPSMAMGIDGTGSVFILGYAHSGGLNMGLLLKYDPIGTLVWSKIYSPSGAGVLSQTMIVTQAGELLVAGQYILTADSSRYNYLIKYDSAGNMLWETTWTNPVAEEVTDIKLDQSGDIYVSGGANIGALAKFDSNGSMLWGETTGQIVAMTLDNAGYVGCASSAAGTRGVFTIGSAFSTAKYRENGELLWEAYYDWEDQHAVNIFRDAGTYIYVAGDAQFGDALDYTIVKYSPFSECCLVPDSTVISRRGTLGLQGTVTNDTNNTWTVLFATRVTKPDGNWYPSSRYLLGPIKVTLNPYESKSKHLSQFIPNTAPLGTYTYHGYVGNYGPVIYDECQFNFEVTP